MNTPMQSETSVSKSRKRLRESVSPSQSSKRHHPDVKQDKENVSFFNRKRRSHSMDSGINRKLVLRKSTDLRQFKSIDEKVEAIVNSPMVEVRKKKSPHDRLSQSFSDSESHQRDLSDHLEEIKFSRKSISFFMERSLNFIQKEQSFNQSTSSNSPGFTSPPTRRKSLRVPPNTPVVFQNDANLMDDSVEPSSHQPDQQELVRHCQLSLYKEWNSLKAIIVDWDAILQEEGSALPDRASGDIRSTIGMANLLLKKKFPFFDNLIQMALGQPPEESDPDLPTSKPSIEDLRGYWGLVLPEVEKINSAFERLAKWRELNWVEVNRPDTPRPSKSADAYNPPVKNVAPPARKTKLAKQLAKSRFAAFKATKIKEMEGTSSSAPGDGKSLLSPNLQTADESLIQSSSKEVSHKQRLANKSVSFSSEHKDVVVTPTQESELTQRYRKTPARVKSAAKSKVSQHSAIKDSTDYSKSLLSPNLQTANESLIQSSSKEDSHKQNLANKSVCFSSEHKDVVVTPTQESELTQRYRKTPARVKSAAKSKVSQHSAIKDSTDYKEMHQLRSQDSVIPASSTPLASTSAKAKRNTRSKLVSFSSSGDAPDTPKHDNDRASRYRKTPRKKNDI